MRRDMEREHMVREAQRQVSYWACSQQVLSVLDLITCKFDLLVYLLVCPTPHYGQVEMRLQERREREQEMAMRRRMEAERARQQQEMERRMAEIREREAR